MFKFASIFVCLILILGALCVVNMRSSEGTTTGSHYLGFWIDAANLGISTELYKHPQQFVSGYFGTPPYPSLALFSFGFDQSGDGYWSGIIIPVLQLVHEQYPEAKIIFQIFVIGASFDPGNNVTQQLAYFNNFVKETTPYASAIMGWQLEGEYIAGSSTPISQVGPIMFNDVVNAGMSWIGQAGQSYAVKGQPTLTFVPWPWSGPEDGLYNYAVGSPFIGLQIGFQAVNDYLYDGAGANAFPSTCTSSDLPVPTVDISTSPNCAGSYNQLIINHVIDDILAAPSGRQYIILDVGYSSNGGGYTFIGATGETRQTAMWDNPLLRGWIWNSPNYKSNFELSSNNITMSPSKTQSTSTSPEHSSASASLGIGSSTMSGEAIYDSVSGSSITTSTSENGIITTSSTSVAQTSTGHSSTVQNLQNSNTLSSQSIIRAAIIIAFVGFGLIGTLSIRGRRQSL